jgi:hypothetical protein
MIISPLIPPFDIRNGIVVPYLRSSTLMICSLRTGVRGKHDSFGEVWQAPNRHHSDLRGAGGVLTGSS